MKKLIFLLFIINFINAQSNYKNLEERSKPAYSTLANIETRRDLNLKENYANYKAINPEIALQQQAYGIAITKKSDSASKFTK